jgi:hypothetical protein
MSDEAPGQTVAGSLAALEDLIQRLHASNNQLAAIVGNQPDAPERPEGMIAAHLNARAALLVPMLTIECNRLDASIKGLG